MFISINEILEDRIEDKKEIIFNSVFEGVDTDTMKKCDIIAISHIGRRLIKALPAYFVDDTKEEIIVDDPNRTLIENSSNKIKLSKDPSKNCPWHIHEINGYKFTMITVELPEYRLAGYPKYWDSDNWL